jgi:hypothetical protein
MALLRSVSSVAPRHELIEFCDLVVGDAAEHVGELGMRINAVEFCRFNRGAGDCCRLSAALRAVPPFYLIRTSNGFFAAGGYALFTAKEARCLLETAFGFVCPPSATLLARQDVPASPW